MHVYSWRFREAHCYCTVIHFSRIGRAYQFYSVYNYNFSFLVQMEIFPYSVFYMYFEQYLDIWRTALINLAIAIGQYLQDFRTQKLLMILQYIINWNFFTGIIALCFYGQTLNGLHQKQMLYCINQHFHYSYFSVFSMPFCFYALRGSL